MRLSRNFPMVSRYRSPMFITLTGKILPRNSYRGKILYNLPIEPDPKKDLKVLTDYVHSLCSKNQASCELYVKLFRFIAAHYLERVIEDKFDEEISLWSKKYSRWFNPQLEEQF